MDAYLRESEEVFGSEPPKPLSERKFSGRFMVRTSPALHARLSMEATEQAVSLNQWVVQKLAGRQPNLDWSRPGSGHRPLQCDSRVISAIS